jgi:hypothetical protein
VRETWKSADAGNSVFVLWLRFDSKGIASGLLAIRNIIRLREHLIVPQ